MEIVFLNIGFAIYFVVSGYMWYKHRHHMTEEALHHMWSHTLIVSFFTITINWWIMQGSWIALVFVIFSFAHLVQHVIKENFRLSKTNRWTRDVHDENGVTKNV